MKCPCCGSAQTQEVLGLWKELIDEWRLARHEADYINRQQGLFCTGCRSNLRTMALANALLACWSHAGPFAQFVRSETATRLRILEVNEAGMLTQFLQVVPGHVIVRHPDADMMRLPFKNGTFDLVVHSDTLEHVPQPVRGLSECRRVLAPGGFCAFTVPIVVDRLTASREGKPPSYHGSPENRGDYLVQTEYGADAWKHVVLAGFRECRIVSLEYPAGLAMVGVK